MVYVSYYIQCIMYSHYICKTTVEYDNMYLSTLYEEAPCTGGNCVRCSCISNMSCAACIFPFTLIMNHESYIIRYVLCISM